MECSVTGQLARPEGLGSALVFRWPDAHEGVRQTAASSVTGAHCPEGWLWAGSLPGLQGSHNPEGLEDGTSKTP